MKKLKVEVTAEDIRRGKRWSEYHCPIARATKRILGEKDLTVGSDDIDVYFGGGCDSVIYALPKKAMRFIEHFDDDDGKQSVQPFTFTLRRAK